MGTDAEIQRTLGRHLVEFERIESQRPAEYRLPPLDSFTVAKREAITDPVKIHDAMSEEENER